MGITILKNNVPWGPFTRAQIEEGLVRGDFTLQYLAHAPGLKQWLPLGEVLHFVDAGATLPPVPASRELPAVPEAPQIIPPKMPVVPPPPPTKPTVIPQAPQLVLAPPIPRPEIHLDKAPFVPRAIAFFMDCVVLFVPVFFLIGLSALTIQLQGWWQQVDKESMRQEWALLDRNFHQLAGLVAIGFAWLYAAGLESSRRQATLGKRWMGLKVTDAAGERISFLRATGRHAAKYLSALPCFLGFMMALFSSRGRAFHDRLADTRVIRQ